MPDKIEQITNIVKCSREIVMRAVEDMIEFASFAAFFVMVAFGFGLTGNPPLV